MSKYKVYSPDRPEETELERTNRQLSRTVAGEGIVLLENDGTLPYKGENIALYGAGARHTVRGGSGSGDMRERYSVTIAEGLEKNGYTLTSSKWLNGYDRYYDKHLQEWKDIVEADIAKNGPFSIQAPFDAQGRHPLTFPVGEVINDDELTDSGDLAIYVIARQAGEGSDRKVEPGDYLLDDIEIKNLESLDAHYKKIVVIVNSGGIVDLTPIDNLKHLGAMLYVSQPGTEGGNAVADIISGHRNPSGRLADTWALRYEDYPSYDTYSYRNGNVEDEDYLEGIYVGYRYFDAKNIRPRYSFGYGLSYTTFGYHLTQINKSGSKVALDIEVNNTGNFAGKDVIEVFAVFLCASIPRERKRLVAFSKTDELESGKAQKITVSFDIARLASFYTDEHCYKIEAGTCKILIGDGMGDFTYVANIKVDEDIVTEYVRPIDIKWPTWQDLDISCADEEIQNDLPDVSFVQSDIKIVTHDYVLHEKLSAQVEERLNALTDKEIARLLVGGSLAGKCYNNTPGAVGRTTSSLVKKGIANINMCDGPAGVNVFPQMVITKGGSQKYLGTVPDSYNWGVFKKLKPFMMGKPTDGRPCYQYMTAWPNETLQAQTWNISLLESVGKAVGHEMVQIGATLWLAPAMNIHRNPLCGRNFEYYSEDPVLTGACATALTEGVQSNPGVGVTIKHFCCNNQECNREHVSSNVSERSLREIYLYGFKECVKNAHPWAVMSPYNRVNNEYVNNSYGLLTQVLRMEWGFDGLVMSDWNATGDTKGDNLLCQVAGNDIIMPGSGKIVKALYKAIENGTIRREIALQSAARVLAVVDKSLVKICNI